MSKNSEAPLLPYSTGSASWRQRLRQTAQYRSQLTGKLSNLSRLARQVIIRKAAGQRAAETLALWETKLNR